MQGYLTVGSDCAVCRKWRQSGWSVRSTVLYLTLRHRTGNKLTCGVRTMAILLTPTADSLPEVPYGTLTERDH